MSQEIYKTDKKCPECGSFLSFITWYANGDGGFYYNCLNCHTSYHLNEEIVESMKQDDKNTKQKEYEKNEEKLKELRDNIKKAKDALDNYRMYPSTYGWVCPRCGRGNAPWTSTCPCIPQTYEVTC